jgi:hypothetical protein
MTKQVTKFEDLRLDCIARLKQIESNLRIKGDIWRAEKCKKFRVDVFGADEDSLVVKYRRQPC